MENFETMFSSQQAIEFWSKEAEKFLTVSRQPNSFYHKRNEIIARLACKHASPCAALDVGSAEGDLVLKLCNLGYTAYGTDISRPMIDKAVSKAALILPEAAARFRLTQGSTLPFVEKFDLITVIGVLPYVNDHAAYVAYLSSMLNKDGILIITCTNPFSFYNFAEVMKHVARLRFDKSWLLQWKNMCRTGLHSGGFVDLENKRQVHSAHALKKLLRKSGYKVQETVSFYNIGLLDAEPLARGNAEQLFARWFGWTHLAVARKLQ
jgi:2-polyprenyl-3-methyl-5-hydroxy-6-metoxy-1,4-benzoquinol methylase